MTRNLLPYSLSRLATLSLVSFLVVNPLLADTHDSLRGQAIKTLISSTVAAALVTCIAESGPQMEG